MRDRDQRLRWIEKLIGGTQQGTASQKALVIPATEDSLAIAFASIDELVASDDVKSIAFLADEYCGVLRRGNELAPVVDVGGNEGEPGHVVLVRGGGCLLGLKFRGTPYVVDLDEADQAISPVRPEHEPSRKAFPLLDVDALIEGLLAKE